MTKITLSPFLICRTPVFPIHEDLGKVWDELKNYIHESSPAFFEVIKDNDYADLASLSPKIRFTIWKYFNRAKYRATPFGNFAAFSIIPLGRENEAEPIVLSQKTIAHRFPNWLEKEQVSSDARWLSKHAGFLRANTTAYFFNQDLRFITIEDGAFELSVIEVEKITLATLDFCHLQRTMPELQQFLQKSHHLDKALATYFIEQLIDSQLLLTDFHPNIIGADYFSRIGYPKTERINDYTISERTRISGTLSEKNLQVLLALTDFLNRHSVKVPNAALTDFRRNFSRRFDNKEIPLLVAMDPEIGIGYRSLAQAREEDQLIEDLKAYRAQIEDPLRPLNLTPLYQFILNEMMLQNTVYLDHFNGPGITSNIPVANTGSIILQFSDHYLLAEQFGGCTANSLLGRFSIASKHITEMAHQFAKTEQEANADILFFDIGYQIEKNADNINRRQSIYDYEMPILSWSGTKNILDPDDIRVSVKGEELILYSIKYKKRIIPKLASAYNYSRSDLPIYRFLSDLQHQSIHSSLGINLLEIFPGLKHYPRVQYKNVVLFTEKWRVPEQLTKEANTDLSMKFFRQWLSGIQLKQPFKAGSGDQTLLFNPDKQEDLFFFLLFCRNKTDLYIEEALLPAHPLISDQAGNSYLSEVIVNLEHREQIYHPYVPKTAEKEQHTVKSFFSPGEEWLYFEIYCHPSNCNSLLLKIAKNYLPTVKKKLKKWFFIRYNDPSYHIRLRLQLRDPGADLGILISGLSSFLKADISSGIIADLQLKTYRRETERYGWGSMDKVEQCFAKNSDLALYLISKELPIHSLYGLSILLLENIMTAKGFTLSEQLQFTEHIAGLFALEMKVSSEGLKRINQGYKEFGNSFELLRQNQLFSKKINHMMNSFLSPLGSCPASERNTLLTDLFHMHVNRLFNNDQRMHEMVIYQYLTRRLKMKTGRLKQRKTTIIL